MHSTFTLGCELCAHNADERLVCLIIASALLLVSLYLLWRLNRSPSTLSYDQQAVYNSASRKYAVQYDREFNRD